MSDNYAKWLEGEKSWIDKAEQKYKKDALKYSVLIIAGCIVVLGAIGLLAGGGIDIEGMLHNMLIGLILGVVFALFMPILVKSSLPANRYMKRLKSEIEDVLTPEERENFAVQMLGTEKEVKCISWIGEYGIEGKVRITRDYALKTSEDGVAVMVQLPRVLSVENDVKEYTITGRGGGFKVQKTMTVYPMYFYYQKSGQGEKRKQDKEFTFESRQIRGQVSECLREMKVGER